MSLKISKIYKFFLILEFVVLCLVVPGYIILNRYAPFMFAFLWGATLYCFLIVRFFYFKGWRAEWGWDAVRPEHFRPILVRWVAAAILMVVFVQYYAPENAFSLIRERPEILPYIFLLYPVLSALPQEFIFCSFFFRRYEPFFGKGGAMVLTSAAVFAYAHILYINPVAPVLSFLGGIVFAMTYRQHRSLALVTIEHSLYGITLFLIGLGKYFYSGGVN